MSRLLEFNRSQLVIIDMQENSTPAIAKIEHITPRINLLLDAAHRFTIPVALSKHIKPHLGAVLPLLDQGDAALFEKVHFSAMAGKTGFAGHLARQGRPQIVVAGCEAHVCVLQTVLHMIDAGHDVHVVADGIGSRRPEDRLIAIERMQAAGATLVSTEMVAFEWMERGDRDVFHILVPELRDLE